MRRAGMLLELKRERSGNRSEVLLILLRFKLFCPVHMGIGDFDAVNDDPNATDKISDERFFVHAVTVPESVAVKQNIPCHSFSVNAKEKMYAYSAKQTEEAGIGVIQGGAAV